MLERGERIYIPACIDGPPLGAYRSEDEARYAASLLKPGREIIVWTVAALQYPNCKHKRTDCDYEVGSGGPIVTSCHYCYKVLKSE